MVAREIADKLGYTPGVSYSEIAIKAADYGRKQLAIKLLDYEPRADLQVPLLLRLGTVRVHITFCICIYLCRLTSSYYIMVASFYLYLIVNNLTYNLNLKI